MLIANPVFDFLIQKHQLRAVNCRANTENYSISYSKSQHNALYLSSDELTNQDSRPETIQVNGIVYRRGNMHLTVEAIYDANRMPFHDTTEYFRHDDLEKIAKLKLRVFYDVFGNYKNYHLQQLIEPVTYVRDVINESKLVLEKGPFADLLQSLIDEEKKVSTELREKLRTENDKKLSVINKQFNEKERIIAEKLDSLKQKLPQFENLPEIKMHLENALALLKQGDECRRNLQQKLIANTHIFNQFLSAIDNFHEQSITPISLQISEDVSDSIAVISKKKKLNKKDKKQLAQEKEKLLIALIAELNAQYKAYEEVKSQQMRDFLRGILSGNVDLVKQWYDSPYLIDKMSERFEGLVRAIENGKDSALLEKQIQVAHFLYQNSSEYRHIIADRELSFAFEEYGIAKRVLFKMYLSNNPLAFQMFLNQNVDTNADAVLFERELRLFNLLPCIIVDILLKGTFSENMDVDLYIQQFISPLLKCGARTIVRTTLLNEKVILGNSYDSTEFGLGKSGCKKKVEYGFREKCQYYFELAANKCTPIERESFGLIYSKMFDELMRAVEHKNCFIWLLSLVNRLKIQITVLSNPESMKHQGKVMPDDERASQIRYAEKQAEIVFKILSAIIKYIDFKEQIDAFCYFAQTETSMQINTSEQKICSIKFVCNQEEANTHSFLELLSNTVREGFLSLSVKEKQKLLKKMIAKEVIQNQKGFFAIAQFLISTIEEPTLQHYDCFFRIVALRYKNNIHAYQSVINSAPMMMLKMAFHIQLSEEQKVELSDPNRVDLLEDDKTAYVYIKELWENFPEIFLTAADSKNKEDLLKEESILTRDDSRDSLKYSRKNMLWQPAPAKEADDIELNERNKYEMM